jgi:hypothetical protein
MARTRGLAITGVLVRWACEQFTIGFHLHKNMISRGRSRRGHSIIGRVLSNLLDYQYNDVYERIE